MNLSSLSEIMRTITNGLYSPDTSENGYVVTATTTTTPVNGNIIVSPGIPIGQNTTGQQWVTQTVTPTFTCLTCGLVYGSLEGLEVHQHTAMHDEYTNPFFFGCSLCDFRATSMLVLQNHTLDWHPRSSNIPNISKIKITKIPDADIPKPKPIVKLLQRRQRPDRSNIIADEFNSDDCE